MRKKPLLCSDMVKVGWTGEDGRFREEVAILEDVSPAGASLFMGVRVPVGVGITIATPSVEFTGEVQRCVDAPNGYLASVRFPNAQEWPGATPGYRPEHLLDLTRLDFRPDREE